MRERFVDPRRFTQEMLTDIDEILIRENNVDYLHQRLPSARDKEIGELVAPILQGAEYRSMRERITSDHADVLSAFSERMASVAVHQKDQSLLVVGLVALVLGGLDRGDKEAILVLPLHYKSAEKLGADPADVFESAARLVGDPGATQLRAFVKGSEAERSLSSMGYREVADGGGLLYERTW